MGRGVYFAKFWQHHYFDWMTFLRRAGIYGIGGGLVLGTVLFGNPHLALRRVYNRYQNLTAWGGVHNDLRNSASTYHIVL